MIIKSQREGESFDVLEISHICHGNDMQTDGNVILVKYV